MAGIRQEEQQQRPNRFSQFAPEPAAPQNRFAQFDGAAPDDYGIDFTAGHEGVRLALESLPEKQREPAMRQWAETRMANPQGADALLAEAGGNAPGRSIMMGFADEAGAGIDAGLNAISGGRIGAPYDEGLALRRAAESKYDTENPVKSTLGQIAGGFAVPGIGGGATALRRIGSAAAGGAVFSGANQFGNNEGGDGNLQQQFVNRLEGVPEAAAIGAGAGTVLSGVAEGARGISQLAARHGTRTRDAVTKTIEALPDKSVDKLADQLSKGSYNTDAANQAKLRKAFDIMGEEMVAANGNAAVGQAAALRRIEVEMGVKPKTAKEYISRINEGHKDSELFALEYPSVAASDDATRTIKNFDEPTIDRLRSSEDTSAQTTFAYVSRAGGTQGQQKMRTAFAERTMRQKGPLRAWIDEAAPSQLKSFDDAEGVLDAINAKAKTAYEQLHALGDNGYDSQLIMRDLPRVLQKHLDEAARSGGGTAKALRDGIDKFYIKTAGTTTRTPILKNGKPTGQYKTVNKPGDKIAMPTLKILQHQRADIRKMIGDLKGDPIKKTDNGPGYKELTVLYKDITDVMRRSSPRWAAANDMHADGKMKKRLMDFAANLTKNPSDAQRTAFKHFDKTSDEGKQWMQMRVLQHIDDMIAGKGDTHDLAKLYTNENWRKIVTKVFPRHRIETSIKNGKTVKTKVLDRTGEKFIRLIRDMQVGNRNMTRATGNSVTPEMLEMNKNMDADINLIANAQNLNAQGVREWLIQTAVNTLKSHRVREMEKLLSVQARDVPATAQMVEKLRIQDRRNKAAKNAKRSDVPQRGGYAANVFADGDDE